MAVEDSQSAAYGLLAMVVGLSFFRVANIPPANDEDNRYICEDYVKRFYYWMMNGRKLGCQENGVGMLSIQR